MPILDLPPHNNPQEDRASTAPYNFVPLPETIVITAENAPEKLPGHDSYATEGYPHTGYFDVTLTTKSPLFVRGMLTRSEFDLDEQGRDRLGLDANGKDAQGNQVRNGATPFADRLKNKPDFFNMGDATKPVIPGSSLRGMLRSMVEIISYGKFGPMSKSTKISYRAVAAPDDPLSVPYDDILGRNGRNVSTGYLVKQNGKWKIQPAKKPSDLGLSERGAYLKVKDNQWLLHEVSGLKRFNDRGYRPQFRPVSFEIETRTDRQGRRYTAVTKIGSDLTAYKFKGALVCSGNMLETSEQGQESSRKNYSLVLEPDRKTPPIEIVDEAIVDYMDSLTAFLKENPPFDPVNGCLVEYQPVFFVQRNGRVICFGHCPNFRVPAFLTGTNRASTTLDFLPSALYKSTDVDFTDAIFGYVEKKWPKPKQGSKSNAYAGRVSVTDATTTTTEADAFLPNGPFPPEILATPKPTAFQHYLTQQNDAKRNLKHYGSSTGEATIRGFKRYWLQGDKTADELRAKPHSPSVDEDGKVEQDSTQHTLINPVRSGVCFRFRIFFESLSDAELGVLCWALHPFGDAGKTYCHQLGMGKAVGMGAVKLDAMLHLNNRKTRYESLFAGEGWATGYEEGGMPLSANDERIKSFTNAFEQEVLRQLGNPCDRLADLKRIAILLRMMQWEELLPAEQIRTQDLKDGFKQRRVLPDPSAWIPDAERVRLVTPTPTQGMVKNRYPRNEADSASQHRALQSGMGNTLVGNPVPSSPAPSQSITREQVTLIGQIRNGRAQVRTAQEERVTCEKMPTSSWNAPKVGAVIWAKVERGHDGKAISARYIPE